MERLEAAHEYENLNNAVYARRIPEIDVADKVMSRISGQAPRRIKFGGTMRSSTALASLFALLLVVSVTAYGASEYIQLRNKSGDVKVQFVPPDTGRITDNPYEKYIAKARKFAEPGELIAVYAKDGANLPLGPMQFHFKPKRLQSYSDFVLAIERIESREFPQAMGGYEFEYGEISPAVPEKGTKLYQDTLKELERLASQSSDKENMVMKAIPWSSASGVSGIYSKAGTRIGIYATNLNGKDVYAEKQEDQTTEKIEIAGTEVVYNEVKKEIVKEMNNDGVKTATLSYGYLNWYDEDQDAYYTLTNFKGAKLSREQLLELVREWLEKKG